MDLEKLANNILQILRLEGGNIVPKSLMSSPRSVGDAVQEFLSERGLAKSLEMLGIANIENNFSRRAMEDIAFEDNEGKYYAVDVKTHNLQTEFNMPNLISVKRLANFYRNDKNTFCILIVSYEIKEDNIEYKQCFFKPIEAFDWSCLTLGALGWGQIQIANANTLVFCKNIDRKNWMLKMCDKLELFYDEEIGKIRERKTWFSKIRIEWEKK